MMYCTLSPKSFLLASLSVIAFVCSTAQTAIRPNGKYQVGDTHIEVDSWKDLNSIREFKRLRRRDSPGGRKFYMDDTHQHETDTMFYKDYYLDTKKIHEEGMFVGGWCVGIRRYYSKTGHLEKEIDYSTNTKTLYGKSSEPYDEVLRAQKQSGYHVDKKVWRRVF